MQLAEACPGRGSHGQNFRHFCKEEALTAQTTPDIGVTDKDLSMEETPDPGEGSERDGAACLPQSSGKSLDDNVIPFPPPPPSPPLSIYLWLSWNSAL